MSCLVDLFLFLQLKSYENETFLLILIFKKDARLQSRAQGEFKRDSDLRDKDLRDIDLGDRDLRDRDLRDRDLRERDLRDRDLRDRDQETETWEREI